MILVHVCCADCVLRFIKSVDNKQDIGRQNISLFYYNPNIHPRSEYLTRVEAVKKVIEKYNLRLILPNWQPKNYFNNLRSMLKNKFNIPNRRLRCPLCWRLRLKSTFEYAKKNSYDIISSTLLVSQYQDKKAIINISKNLSKKYHVSFFVPKKIISNLKTHGFYKQNYCGCVYSLIERFEEKYFLK
jgi:predicted adenine nucleotide alpha hydrolase (AANH) superfamily ATPase